MKNSTTARVLEKSLPFYRILRIGIGVALVFSLLFSILGELFDPNFDRSFHWFWIVSVVAFAASYPLQWIVEGEAQRYKDLGDV